VKVMGYGNISDALKCTSHMQSIQLANVANRQNQQ
jgi:hypothetical protein